MKHETLTQDDIPCPKCGHILKSKSETIDNIIQILYYESGAVGIIVPMDCLTGRWVFSYEQVLSIARQAGIEKKI